MRTVHFASTLLITLVALGEVRCVGEDPGDPSPTDGGSAEAGSSGASGSSSSSGGVINRRTFDKVKQLVAGDAFTCARSESGLVRCWGANVLGQLGQNSRAPFRSDVSDTSTIDFGTEDPVIDLATSFETACALFQKGDVRCWGANGAGERGVGNTAYKGAEPGDTLRLEAVDLGEDRAATRIFAGTRHFCAILQGGGVACWGYGAEKDGRFGWLGNGNAQSVGDQPGEMGAALVHADLPEQPVEMALGYTVTCARSASSVRCWGVHRAGQLGSGSVENDGALDQNKSLAALAPIANSVKELYGNGPAFAAKLEDGSVVTWGQNDYGQLGFGDTLDRGVPTALPSKGPIRLVRSRSRHRCIVQVDSSLYCLGNANAGQLGYGDTNPRGNAPEVALDKLTTPVLTDVADVAVGGTHTCALKNDGSVVCFGLNQEGQLGYGDTTNRGGDGASIATSLVRVPNLGP